ncbi:response regulator transcription factor [Candidatus Solirubrobacter pratensis]|uniref:response regulator transcription factor n=1 Tax=Candidatus Solirubrobacter pratensis TaxID=1298857 RepID=UPI0004077F91|nr:response regulator transcription factor [Candidatus Solirubrobacter pratensis]
MSALAPGTTAGICEDDDELRGVLRQALEREGLAVRATASGTEAVRAFAERPPDVLVLDIGLPDADGRDVCQALRARGVASPVLFLTARDALADRVSGFHAGGDDYLTKPFAIAELIVRIHALLRRAGTNASEPGDIALEPAGHAVSLGAARAELSATEYRLLAALAARRGAVLRRRELVAAAWPPGAIVHDNALDTHVARIRRKLRDVGAPEAIETVRGVGYVLR